MSPSPSHSVEQGGVGRADTVAVTVGFEAGQDGRASFGGEDGIRGSSVEPTLGRRGLRIPCFAASASSPRPRQEFRRRAQCQQRMVPFSSMNNEATTSSSTARSPSADAAATTSPHQPRHLLAAAGRGTGGLVELHSLAGLAVSSQPAYAAPAAPETPPPRALHYVDFEAAAHRPARAAAPHRLTTGPSPASPTFSTVSAGSSNSWGYATPLAVSTSSSCHLSVAPSPPSSSLRPWEAPFSNGGLPRTD